ncbi:uncharacterized protein B0T23DRAFT_184203 [Neurospora hispaniola]|uniref:Uncharacterized protein n=1 Tax=Neurospora hispaniola TaxID=588809 RepID=A0AAJ0I2W8_9PEZI|nr:hypothetical protein B0T23DRAFT_184203 [Neurospora hispaniola]
MTAQVQATPRPTASPGSLLQCYQSTVLPPATSTPLWPPPRQTPTLAPRHLDTPRVQAAAAAERHSVGRPVLPAIAIPSPVHRYVHLSTNTATVHRLYHRRRLIGADCTQRAVIVIRVRPARPHISIFTPWPSTPFSRPTDDCPILACPGLSEHTGPAPEFIINDHERSPSPCPLHRPGSSNYPLLPLDTTIEFTSTTIHAVSPSRRPTPKPFHPPSRN